MGRTIRTCMMAALVATLTAGTVSIAEARIATPNAKIGCLGLNPGAVNFCAAVEQRHAIQVLRWRQSIQTQRTHANLRAGRYLGWNVVRLKLANLWERDRLTKLLKLPTWQPVGSVPAWTCIHGGEGAWTDAGDPYWGGLQMDRGFMAAYGRDMIERHHGGLADTWTPREQMVVAERARVSGRGYAPWPVTSRRCGLR
jgi:hypothetical protein